jgi:hypothetical protein
MKWSNRLRERRDERMGSPLVWWVKHAEAERVIKALRKQVRELEDTA